MVRYLLTLLMFGVGVLNSTQAPLNGMLAKRSNLIAAVTMTFTIGLVICVVLVVLTKTDLKGLFWGKPWEYLSGVCAVTFVMTSAYLAPRIGLVPVVSANISAQLIAGLIMDKYGLLGLNKIGLSSSRIVGCFLLLAGVVLVARK